MALLDFSSGHSLVSMAIVFLSIAFLVCYTYEYVQFKRKYRFPNIVPGWPIIGNSLQMPAEAQGPYLEKMANKYGEMFTMRFGSKYWVFLNSRRVAAELLDKKAPIYSSRQDLIAAHDLISGGMRLLTMPYGDRWRRMRKAVHQILNISQAGMFEGFQDIESRALLYEHLEIPDLWWLSHARYANSVIMSVVFGRRCKVDDPELAKLLAVGEEFVKYLMPGRACVDIFPFLVRIPWLKKWQPWRNWADRINIETISVYQKQIDDLHARMRLGKQNDCFMSEFMKLGKNEEFTEEELCFVTGALMEAGSDTTRVSLHEMVAGAVLFPDWVERARQELDAVCGANAERLPEFQDKARLPLIKAAVKETIRWKPTIAETGIPHALTQDDEFEGYRFPAGTVFTWNHWGISNNPREYQQPERFWPERFVNEDLDKVTKGHLGFGAGRRICVGAGVAANNLFISIARLLYCFDYSMVPGEPIDTSKPFPPSNTGPPFKVQIRVRSEAHRQLIERECREAMIF